MRPARTTVVGSLLFIVGIVIHSISDQWPLFDTHQQANGHDYWAPDPTLSSLLDYGGVSLTILGGLIIVVAVAAQLISHRQPASP